MNSYELSKQWFDFCFENPEKIKPNHTALYFFAIEHCNRLGWKEKFGFPTEMAKDAIGIKNYKTYSNTLNDLVKWKFIKMIEKSKNQYSANIIALVKNTKAHTKALSKARLKHGLKQVQSIVSIDKPNNKEPNNKEPNNKECVYSFKDFWNDYEKKIGLNKSKPKFEILSDKNKLLIKDYLPKYKAAQPNKKFRKNPEVFLNNESWNDEIISDQDQKEEIVKPKLNL